MTVTAETSIHIQGPSTVDVRDVGGGTLVARLSADVVFIGKVEDLERFAVDLDSLVQAAAAAHREGVAEQPKATIVLVEQVAVGDAISFDGARWVVVTKVEPDPIAWTVALSWRTDDGDDVGPVPLPYRDAIRRRQPTVHALEARSA